jgi:hypothetical protein
MAGPGAPPRAASAAVPSIGMGQLVSSTPPLAPPPARAYDGEITGHRVASLRIGAEGR